MKALVSQAVGAMTKAQRRMLAITAGLIGVSPIVVWPFAGFQVALMLAETYAITLALVCLCALWVACFESLGRKP